MSNQNNSQIDDYSESKYFKNENLRNAINKNVNSIEIIIEFKNKQVKFNSLEYNFQILNISKKFIKNNAVTFPLFVTINQAFAFKLFFYIPFYEWFKEIDYMDIIIIFPYLEQLNLKDINYKNSAFSWYFNTNFFENNLKDTIFFNGNEYFLINLVNAYLPLIEFSTNIKEILTDFLKNYSQTLLNGNNQKDLIIIKNFLSYFIQVKETSDNLIDLYKTILNSFKINNTRLNIYNIYRNFIELELKNQNQNYLLKMIDIFKEYLIFPQYEKNFNENNNDANPIKCENCKMTHNRKFCPYCCGSPQVFYFLNLKKDEIKTEYTCMPKIGRLEWKKYLDDFIRLNENISKIKESKNTNNMQTLIEKTNESKEKEKEIENINYICSFSKYSSNTNGEDFEQSIEHYLKFFEDNYKKESNCYFFVSKEGKLTTYAEIDFIFSTTSNWTLKNDNSNIFLYKIEKENKENDNYKFKAIEEIKFNTDDICFFESKLNLNDDININAFECIKNPYDINNLKKQDKKNKCNINIVIFYFLHKVQYFFQLYENKSKKYIIIFDGGKNESINSINPDSILNVTITCKLLELLNNNTNEKIEIENNFYIIYFQNPSSILSNFMSLYNQKLNELKNENKKNVLIIKSIKSILTQKNPELLKDNELINSLSLLEEQDYQNKK